MFRLLGFDVHVRMGFVIFLGLIIFLYQDDFGLWLAGGLAVFTLIHELGHAVAARSAGAHAEISLDFLAGYTSFRPDPRRPISLSRQALISVAGPAVHIAVSMAVLAAMGVNGFSLDSVGQSNATAALWWAGPAIGAINLIPVLPLDGGHIVLAGVEGVIGQKAMRAMAIASITVTGAGAIYMFTVGRGAFGIFIAFLLISQFQILQSTGSRKNKGPTRATDAETVAWQTGRPGILEPGQRLSPWYEAHRALIAGNQAGAVKAITDDLASPTPGRWAPPHGASPGQLQAVVDVLPDELPAANPQSARVAAEVMLATGNYQRGGDYAAKAFNQHHRSPLAISVARAAAAAGDTANAVAWLSAAEHAARDEPDGYLVLLGKALDQAPEFAQLRDSPDFGTLRARLSA